MHLDKGNTREGWFKIPNIKYEIVILHIHTKGPATCLLRMGGGGCAGEASFFALRVLIYIKLCVFASDTDVVFLENLLLESQDNTSVILSPHSKHRAWHKSVPKDFKLFAHIPTKRILKNYVTQKICKLTFKFFISLTSYKAVISKML